MGRPALTVDQLKRRQSLMMNFRLAIRAAIWQEIERVDQSLLCANDGTPYGEMKTATMQVTSLEQMVTDATKAACESLKNWL